MSKNEYDLEKFEKDLSKAVDEDNLGKIEKYFNKIGVKSSKIKHTSSTVFSTFPPLHKKMHGGMEEDRIIYIYIYKIENFLIINI